MLAANEVDGVEDGDKSIEKCGKSLKIGISSKSGNLKGKKLAKSKKKSKSGNSPNFNTTEAGSSFLIPEARSAINRLWLAFTKALILWHFDPECHIWIKIDVLGYVIGDVLNQLASRTSSDEVVTKTNLGQWHLVAYFSGKMVPAKTWYKTHNGKLLAIVEAFKTWHHYLEDWKHKFLILTNHNNFRCFGDIKNLSSQQVR